MSRNSCHVPHAEEYLTRREESGNYFVVSQGGVNVIPNLVRRSHCVTGDVTLGDLGTRHVISVMVTYYQKSCSGLKFFYVQLTTLRTSLRVN